MHAALRLLCHCRHHFGLHLRDSALNVADINGCQPHPRPGPRAAAFKGHPDGPQREPAIKPRRPEAPVDNSLRTLDIEGARCGRALVALTRQACARMGAWAHASAPSAPLTLQARCQHHCWVSAEQLPASLTHSRRRRCRCRICMHATVWCCTRRVAAAKTFTASLTSTARRRQTGTELICLRGARRLRLRQSSGAAPQMARCLACCCGASSCWNCGSSARALTETTAAS